jgi:hypothetical protein
VTASMLRRTEPVVSLVSRFERRVQSKRTAAPTSWTRRFAKRSADAAIGCLRSAPRVIAATRIARPRVAQRLAARRSTRPATAIGAVPKGASIIAITSARIAPA